MNSKDKELEEVINYVIHDANNVFTLLSFLLEELSMTNEKNLSLERIHKIAEKGKSRISERSEKLKSYSLIYTSNKIEKNEVLLFAIEVLIEKKLKMNSNDLIIEVKQELNEDEDILIKDSKKLFEEINYYLDSIIEEINSSPERKAKLVLLNNNGFVLDFYIEKEKKYTIVV